MLRAKKHLQIHQMTVRQFDEQFPDETACRLYLQKYLLLYVNEFKFRYTNENSPDIFGAAIRAC